MSNFLKKLLFLLKRPPVIVVTGNDRALVLESILQVLKGYFKVGREILIFQTDLEKVAFEKSKFLIKHSSLPILVVTGGENTEIKKIARVLPVYGFLILNFDDETNREIKNETKARLLTYGFQERADLKVTDINTSPEGTNFKINYQGKIVPFWLKKPFDKEQIYSTLTAIAVGIAKDLNLVEISQALSN